VWRKSSQFSKTIGIVLNSDDGLNSAQGSETCPICKSSDVVPLEPPTAESGLLVQTIVCRGCSGRWDLIYAPMNILSCSCKPEESEWDRSDDPPIECKLYPEGIELEFYCSNCANYDYLIYDAPRLTNIHRVRK